MHSSQITGITAADAYAGRNQKDIGNVLHE